MTVQPEAGDVDRWRLEFGRGTTVEKKKDHGFNSVHTSLSEYTFTVFIGYLGYFNNSRAYTRYQVDQYAPGSAFLVQGSATV